MPRRFRARFLAMTLSWLVSLPQKAINSQKIPGQSGHWHKVTYTTDPSYLYGTRVSSVKISSMGDKTRTPYPCAA